MSSAIWFWSIRFLKVFHHTWPWMWLRLCDQDCLNRLPFPWLMKLPYEILLRLIKKVAEIWVTHASVYWNKFEITYFCHSCSVFSIIPLYLFSYPNSISYSQVINTSSDTMFHWTVVVHRYSIGYSVVKIISGFVFCIEI